MPVGINHLYVPGPTNIPEAVRRALNMPMEDHRAPDFPDFTRPLFADLMKVFKLESGRVFLYPSSGTGAWEAAITNTLRPGDRVLMSRFGQFSHLWADMAQRLGLNVICHDVPWGTGVPLDRYARSLADEPNIKAIFATHNETTTGVTSDVASVRRLMDAAGSNALLFVDGVSSIGSLEFEQEAWGVDLAVAGSQKGFMLPAGLSVLGVSQKALEAARQTTTPRCYFDFSDMARTNDQGFFPYTPPVPLLRGLRVAVDLLLAEGLDNVAARHNHLAEGVRRGIAGLGLDLCAVDPIWYSDTVSAICVPPGIDAAEVGAIAYRRYHTSFGGGLGQVAGKVFRIGHLGDLNQVSCLAALAAAELALVDAGADIELGAGVAAAQRYYCTPVTAAVAA